MIAAEELLGKLPNQLPQLGEITYERLDDRDYLSSIAFGISLVVVDGHVAAVFLYGGGKEGFARFPFRVPLDLTFDMSREVVRSRLGSPEESAEAGQMPVLGWKPAWDRFVRDGFELHAEYSEDLTSVQMFTVLPI
ncbi:hypothetical protein SAMN03159338_0365 [Sphingomonas sp. NFR04]|uniref:hypothetical protein n=1 Tax=Sphingomonas sp. NFR04 TaxID=1566283 RepID=UPI0008EF34C6|nr:hypothetical protein [Sphingomonas sp. NFR04]SFI94038.1 hypothetical protein SAMN03159338_0365 [Sphingomonas sp. NFR04]